MAAGMTKKDMIRKKTENHLYFSTFEIKLVIKTRLFGFASECPDTHTHL